MSWGYFTLPTELQNHIVGFMVPSLTNAKVFFTHAFQLEQDIDGIFECVRDLRNFSLTCRAVYTRCAPLLYGVRSLRFDHERVLFEGRPDGMVHPMLMLTT